MLDARYGPKSTGGPVRPDHGTAARDHQQALFTAGALQHPILTSASFSIIATDEMGIIQLFNAGAERMLGYTAAEVVNKASPGDMHDPAEVAAHAQELSLELARPIAAGFEAMTYKASRGVDDIHELTYVRKDGSRFAAVVSITALRDVARNVIGYLLVGRDNSARKQDEVELGKAMAAAGSANLAKSDFRPRAHLAAGGPHRVPLEVKELMDTLDAAMSSTESMCTNDSKGHRI